MKVDKEQIWAAAYGAAFAIRMNAKKYVDVDEDLTDVAADTATHVADLAVAKYVEEFEGKD